MRERYTDWCINVQEWTHKNNFSKRQTDWYERNQEKYRKLKRMKESLREKQTESYHTNVHKQSEDKERQTANI